MHHLVCVITYLAAILMVDHRSHGFTSPTTSVTRSTDRVLVPSQVLHHKAHRSKLDLRKSQASHLLIPSQVLRTLPVGSVVTERSLRRQRNSPNKEQASENRDDFNNPTNATMTTQSRKKSRRRRQLRAKKNSDVPTNGVNSSSLCIAPSTTTCDEQSLPPMLLREGNNPDIYWRSVPMEHLRLHPKFVPLPEHVDLLETLEDARLFRQDSWQWDALHVGRCTTSQAAAALGFLENMAGEVLQVPRSWRRGGRGAYQRLRQSPIGELEGMNRVLCSPRVVSSIKQTAAVSKNPWSSPETAEHMVSGTSFVARYEYELPDNEFQRRKKLSRRYSEAATSTALRMAWGTAQEATALLTALNYFSQRDPGFVMKEVGMCGAGLPLNERDSLLIGASPDAVLCHSDGTIEVCEVKNHCPFVLPFVKKGKSRSGSGKRYRLGDQRLDGSIPSHYIPQIMLEMLCLGPECRSAVMVRQTATKGAVLLRLRRDDEWIEDMLHFLRKFRADFVDKGIAPPPNFFMVSSSREEAARYRRFLNKTMELRNKVEVVATVPFHEIQRVPKLWPLFLDSI